MPWKECHVMDVRLRFVARLLEGEKMAPLCAEFGISRKTGYKIFDRYKDTGVTAFTDRSRRPRRRGHAPAATALTRPADPNAWWCADYKGEFMLGNRRYCYPLTITDFASRYLLTCEALSTTQERFAFTAFDHTFKEFGLPAAIRTDNGVPFARRRRSIDSASWPSGGSAWGFGSSGSNPGTRSRTAGTSGCTAH